MRASRQTQSKDLRLSLSLLLLRIFVIARQPEPETQPNDLRPHPQTLERTPRLRAQSFDFARPNPYFCSACVFLSGRED